MDKNNNAYQNGNRPQPKPYQPGIQIDEPEEVFQPFKNDHTVRSNHNVYPYGRNDVDVHDNVRAYGHEQVNTYGRDDVDENGNLRAYGHNQRNNEQHHVPEPESIAEPVPEPTPEPVPKPIPKMNIPKREETQEGSDESIFEDISLFNLLDAFVNKSSSLYNKITLPAGRHQMIADFVMEYNKLHKKDEGTRTTLTTEDVTMVNNVQGTDIYGLREETLANNKGVNKIIHEGKNILNKKVKITVSDEEVRGQLAVSVFNSVVNQTHIFSHTLPSSGFSMSLVDIPEVDIAKLAKLLNRATVRKSRDTRGNLHSNYGMMVMKEVMDFITGYIYSTSIDVDSYRLGNYIRLTDMPIVILLLMEYIHQKGFEVITSCANTMKYGKDNKPKCDASITARLDLSKLLIVDPDKLDSGARKHLAVTSNNAHSVEEVVKYQNSLRANANKTVTIKSGKTPFTIELKNPTMTDSVEAMDQWETIVRDGVADVTLGKSDEEITQLLHDHSSKTALGMYLHFIASISDSNGNYVVDRDSILNVIISFNSNREVVAEIVNAVKDYIGETTIGYIGYTPYVCSKCGFHNGGTELIGLDMISLGFGLVDLATLNLVKTPHIF